MNDTYAQPTAWRSIPGLIRFATWVSAILLLLYTIVLPGLVIAGIWFAAQIGQYGALS